MQIGGALFWRRPETWGRSAAPRGSFRLSAAVRRRAGIRFVHGVVVDLVGQFHRPLNDAIGGLLEVGVLTEPSDSTNTDAFRSGRSVPGRRSRLLSASAVATLPPGPCPSSSPSCGGTWTRSGTSTTPSTAFLRGSPHRFIRPRRSAGGPPGDAHRADSGFDERALPAPPPAPRHGGHRDRGPQRRGRRASSSPIRSRADGRVWWRRRATRRS
jgi:hypothetical protein